MPYVTEEAKARLRPVVREIECFPPLSGGELNYLITMLVIRYTLNNGLRYQTLNDAVGAMESAKQEFYRRAVVPYEDACIEKNGDVYPLVLT